jgi:hypothetical protein
MYRPGPQIFLDWLESGEDGSHPWELAISYASEDEALARALYQQLRGEIRVFFAPEESAYMWGQDLNKVLPNTYGVDSKFVLVLCSESYVRKHWTMVEYKATTNALGEGRVLIVSLGALPPDAPAGIVYRNSSAASLVTMASTLKDKVRSGK